MFSCCKDSKSTRVFRWERFCALLWEIIYALPSNVFQTFVFLACGHVNFCLNGYKIALFFFKKQIKSLFQSIPKRA